MKPGPEVPQDRGSRAGQEAMPKSAPAPALTFLEISPRTRFQFLLALFNSTLDRPIRIRINISDAPTRQPVPVAPIGVFKPFPTVLEQLPFGLDHCGRHPVKASAQVAMASLWGRLVPSREYKRENMTVASGGDLCWLGIHMSARPGRQGLSARRCSNASPRPRPSMNRCPPPPLPPPEPAR